MTDPKSNVDDPVVEERDEDDCVIVTPEWVEWHLSKTLTPAQIDDLLRKLREYNEQALEVCDDADHPSGCRTSWRALLPGEAPLSEVLDIAAKGEAMLDSIPKPTRGDFREIENIFNHRIGKVVREAIQEHHALRFLTM